MTFNKWLITLLAVLVIADIAILTDVPVLRQVLGFLCFTIIPGLLVIYTLRLGEMPPLKQILLSVGLSLSFLIFVGLLINAVLPILGSETPLSTASLIIPMSVIIAVLGVAAYWRHRNATPFHLWPEIGADFKGKYLSLVLLPLLFPLLTVIGRRLIDGGGSNAVLIALFCFIPLYAILLAWQDKNIPRASYPLAIWMISLSILLARGLMSNYVGSGDVISEYHTFQVVSNNMRWYILEGDNLSASLSIALLPAVYESILGISSFYIFKVILLIPISLVPVIGYVIYEKYLDYRYRFLAVFFYMAQLPFIYLLSGQIRVGIALVSFSLAVMVIFEDRLTVMHKRILFLVFLFSLIIEYYALPVIFLAVMSVYWLIPKIWKKRFRRQPLSVISAIILPAVLIFFWWGQIKTTALSQYIYYGEHVLNNLTGLFTDELRGGIVTSIYTPAYHLSFARQIPGLVQRLSFVTVAIGMVSILFRREWREKFDNYAIIMAACFAILVTFIVVPWISIGYGADRVYIQPLIILAPAFIAGCVEIANGITLIRSYIRRLFRVTWRGDYRETTRVKFLLPVIGLILISEFFASSYLYNQLLVTDDTREIFDSSSDSYSVAYIYDGEVEAAKWLGASNSEKLPVYMGNIRQRNSGEVFEYTGYGVDRKFDIYPFTRRTIVENSYVFLQHLNIVGGRVNGVAYDYGVSVSERGLLSDCYHLYADKNRIFANGSAEIYR